MQILKVQHRKAETNRNVQRNLHFRTASFLSREGEDTSESDESDESFKGF